MTYVNHTDNYDIPYISDNEIMDESDEALAATIIDNQIRAGILGAAGTRVFQNGTFSATILDNTGRTDVTLSPSGTGLPTVQGIANDGLVEVFTPITWTDLATDSFYYLYVQATTDTYSDATSVNIISSQDPITTPDYLLLATVDTTGTANVSPTQPVVNSSPPGKPTGFNLFNLLNNNNDPFGPSLTQSILTILSQLTVILDSGTTALFQQLNPDATLPVITIENVSGQPEVSSSGVLRLADTFIPGGFALSDSANTAYQGIALSIIGALNEILQELLTHINNDNNPHGDTLYQDNIVLSGYLELTQLLLNPPISPPLPPGSPPAPPYFDILSAGELRFGDERGGISLTDPGDPAYLGTANSIIGALNELLGLLNTLTGEVNGFLGSTLPGLSAVIFEIAPEELFLPLHFMLRVSNAEDFSDIVLTKESKTSVTGWYYEYQPPAPPLPPSPPIGPATLPGAILVPDPPPDPDWVSLPSGGLTYNLQLQPDGRPTRVKYEPQSGDPIYSRTRYTIGIQEWNGTYGDVELGAIYFG